MHFAVLGSGAVGGYYGAKLAKAGQRVTFIARGAHLAAIRARGMEIVAPAADSFTVRAEATADPREVGPADVVLLAVKTYDNPTVLPLLAPMMGPATVVLTLQNGVDSPDEVAAVVGADRVLAGPTYIATALEAPGRIVQTGTHRRIVFGEVFDARPSTHSASSGSMVSEVEPSTSSGRPEPVEGRGLTDRVRTIRDAMAGADIAVEAVDDARVPLWEKFIYLAPFAGFTGAMRLPAGFIWGDPVIRAQFLAAAGEVEQIARAEGVAVASGFESRVAAYMDALPPSTRASLLIDLSQGKRIEVEALQGAVVRRGQRAGVATPIMATLYALLKPYAGGNPAVPGP
jgi:2-dehydropantoate 2-reductase